MTLPQKPSDIATHIINGDADKFICSLLSHSGNAEYLLLELKNILMQESDNSDRDILHLLKKVGINQESSSSYYHAALFNTLCIDDNVSYQEYMSTIESFENLMCYIFDSPERLAQVLTQKIPDKEYIKHIHKLGQNITSGGHATNLYQKKWGSGKYTKLRQYDADSYTASRLTDPVDHQELYTASEVLPGGFILFHKKYNFPDDQLQSLQVRHFAPHDTHEYLQLSEQLYGADSYASLETIGGPLLLINTRKYGMIFLKSDDLSHPLPTNLGAISTINKRSRQLNISYHFIQDKEYLLYSNQQSGMQKLVSFDSTTGHVDETILHHPSITISNETDFPSLLNGICTIIHTIDAEDRINYTALYLDGSVEYDLLGKGVHTNQEIINFGVREPIKSKQKTPGEKELFFTYKPNNLRGLLGPKTIKTALGPLK